MKLNENLQLLRQRYKFSQEDVAERLNISRQAVAKWETGMACPDLDNLILLSDIYGVTIDGGT